MNVLLIYPLLSKRRAAIDENKQFWPPLGLAYIAGALEREGHAVEIVDRDAVLRKNNIDFDRVDVVTLERIRQTRPDIVGISVTTPTMPDVLGLSKRIKESFRDVSVVLGGPHVTGEPSLTLTEIPYADVVVRGEGELTMLELAEGRSLDGIKGITYRKDSAVLSNADREPIADIDSLPVPARHLLDMKSYTRPSRFTSRNLSLRTTSIFTARGCPYRCNFCAGPLVFSGKVRFHSPGRVIGEIEELVSRYSIEALYFAEDMFLSSKRRAEELLHAFIERGIHKKVKWFAQAKANIITEELLGLMKEAGCMGVEYGFESGSQRVLDLMNKRLTVEESLRAASLTRRAGLRFQANIIVGYPGETAGDFNETIDFIRKVRPHMIGFNIFMPLPGTPSYDELKRKGTPLPRWEEIGDQEASQVNYADMPPGLFEKMYLTARFKVILPMNLFNFIMDNLNNPRRLLTIGLTQFKGVLIKMWRASGKFIALNQVRDAHSIEGTRVLYLSYNGLLEPILSSQAIPYMKELAKRGFKFFLLTYEKARDIRRVGRKALIEKRDELKFHGIEWRYMVYHKRPRGLSTFLDLAAGIMVASFLIVRKRIAIVHVRGITPGAIAIAVSRLFRVKVLFDMRGLLAEEYAGGGLWREGGFSYRLVKGAERSLLRRADAVTVLTKKHLELNRALEYVNSRGIPMEVVPCCVDTARFDYSTKDDRESKRALGLGDAFVLMYPGKIGTFYLIDEMLDFYKEFSSLVPKAVFFILTHDDTQRLVRGAFERGLPKDKIRIVRDVDFEGIPHYMRLADAGLFFINPYKKIGSSPIKLGEFLASGVPVVINPGVGDTEDIVSENRVGVVVGGFSEAHYARAAKELLTLKEEDEGLKKRCRETAQKHLSLKGGIEKYYEIYNSLR